jgi:hypothetical protein
MEIGKGYVPFPESLDYKIMHSLPLAENYHLGLGLFQNLRDESYQFLKLGAMASLLVNKVGIITGHAHILESNHEFALISLGEELIFPPFGYDLSHYIPVFFMIFPLLYSHGHKEIIIDPLRQLLKNLLLVPADQDRSQGLANGFQVSIADSFSCFRIRNMVAAQKSKERAKPVAINKLDNRVKLIQPILQGSSRQDDSIGRRDALGTLGGPRLPIFDPLGFIKNNQVWSQGFD